jgi:hypothetical protein
MKPFAATLMPLALLLGLNPVPAGLAADTNPPAVVQPAPATGPLAGLVETLHHKGVRRLDTRVAVALELMAPADAGQVILVPDADADVGHGLIAWAELAYFKGRSQIILAHSVNQPDGLALYVYLTSVSGVLEKAAKRVNGGDFRPVPLAEAAPDFQRQVALWQSLADRPDNP